MKREQKNRGMWIVRIFFLAALFCVTPFAEEQKPCILESISSDLPVEKKEYTVMVYMIGSNLESRLGSGTFDMMEMEEAGLDYSRTNLLVYTGGSKRWAGRTPSSCNALLDMGRPADQRIAARTDENKSMGDPECLTEFLNFCSGHYPAEHYALILWDHGGGPVWGYGSDELFEADSLTLPEMQEAMKQTAFQQTGKLDWVGFDACLMSSVETMSVWEPHARFFVASEELEPGHGWDYTWLSILNTTSDPLEITKHIIHSYGAYYEKNRTETSNPDVTLSCADLSKLDGVVKKLDTLCHAVRGGIDMGFFPEIQRIRTQARSFGVADDTTGRAGDSSYDLVDLGSLVRGLGERFRIETEDLKGSLEDLIVSSYSNIEDTSGISLYYPCRNKSQFTEMGRTYESITVSDEYRGLLKSLKKNWSSSRNRDWEVAQPVLDGEEFTLPLTEEQRTCVSEASYTILQKNGEGRYFPVLERCRILPDENGVLHIPADPEAVWVTSGTGVSHVWPVTQLEDTGGRGVYSLKCYVLSQIDFLYFDELNSSVYEIAEIQVADEGEGLYIIRTCSDSGEMASDGKDTILLDQWDAVGFMVNSLIPVQDEKGRFLPVASWTDESGFSMVEMPVDEGFGFVKQPVFPELSGCELVVELTDENGEVFASAPVPLPEQSGAFTEEVGTEQGCLSFRIMEDHAELSGYTGTDISLEIPAYVGGKPVTVIGDSVFGKEAVLSTKKRYFPLQRISLPETLEEIRQRAFTNCQELEEIVIPEKVAMIGDMAFSHCSGLRKISLPEGLERIGSMAFYACDSLEEITLPSTLISVGTGVLRDCVALKNISLAGTCTGCRVEEGVLFSGDGKDLIAYPAAGDPVYDVPFGTERILSGAFSRTQIHKVAFPETLREIGAYAFYNCKELSSADLPENLEKVGTEAFGTSSMMLEVQELPEEPVTIRIGSRMSYIGWESFRGFGSKRFSVSEENPFFCEKQGSLLNKAGDTLLQFATNRKLELIIPEGVVSFSWDIMNFLDAYDKYTLPYTKFDVWVPDSVERFPEGEGFSNKSLLIFHCPAGSSAERFAAEQGITFDNLTETGYEEVEVPVRSGNLTVRLFSDHAVVSGYRGEGESIVIPEEVRGIPVTDIGAGGRPLEGSSGEEDYNGGVLREVVLPDTITAIRDYAFFSSHLRELILPEGIRTIGSYAIRQAAMTIPETVEYLGVGFGNTSQKTFVIYPALKTASADTFTSISGLQEFAQEGENAYFSVRDGLLYSSDGKQLLYCPDAYGEVCVIPEGTEVIAPKAFYGNEMLKRVEFPGSLREIGDHAFSNCSLLSEVIFCEGLETIGQHAFAYTDSLRRIDLPDSLVSVGMTAFSFSGWNEPEEEDQPFSLHIGPNLSYIGNFAFDDFLITEFTVDEKNPYFSARDGYLTDRYGRILLLCPKGKTGEEHVPEGITAFAEYCFDNDNTITDLYIPDSVVSLSGNAVFPYDMVKEQEDSSDYVKQYRITLHCTESSVVYRYAMGEEMTVVLLPEGKQTGRDS